MGRRAKLQVFGKHKRKFDGKFYTLHDLVFRKIEAVNDAKELREQGNRVRVIKTHHNTYVLYVRKGKKD